MKAVRWAAIVLLVAFLGMPAFRPAVSNPATPRGQAMPARVAVPPELAALLERSCMDCQSNAMRWPWYSRVAPVSWYLARHVREGRKEMSFSDWGSYTPRRAARKLQETCDEVRRGTMPPLSCRFVHPSAKLTEAEKRILCDWALAERRRITSSQAQR